MKKLSLVLLLLIVVVAVIYFLIPEKKVDLTKPENWIEERNATRIVNISKATNGASFYDGSTQQYRSGYIETVFDWDGIYKGNGFFKESFDYENKTVMELTPNLNPSDGILQGIIIEKIEQDKPKVYIFLDEDWKRQFGEARIVWGAKFQNTKMFFWNKIADGVYMDEILDDPDRFTSLDYSGITYGGVIVGDLSKEDILAGKTNGTIILMK